MNYFIIIFCIIIISCIFYILQENNIINEIYTNDKLYFDIFYQNNNYFKLINNNLQYKNYNKKYNILIITYDNRKNEKYINIHNNNITMYASKWNYKYKFYDQCTSNVYWCKIFMVLKELQTNNYDFVMWMDSDTIINNFTIDIGEILNNFSSDIYIGNDNNKNGYNLTNAGVFIIKNSIIGKQFLNDCIKNIHNKCINSNGTLRGAWAATCYEQGVMNILILGKYFKYTTIFTNDIILNYDKCNKEVFIMHLYASSSTKRLQCFKGNKN